jgi:hypothetical protein
MMVFPECTSVTNSITKYDDAVLTSAASGVARLVIGLTRQSFHFPGGGVVGRAAPLMIPSYLTGPWSEHWLDPLGPHLSIRSDSLAWVRHLRGESYLGATFWEFSDPPYCWH